MNLTIDIGNTSSKYAIFNKMQTVISGKIPSDEILFYKKIVEEYPIKRAIFSSVVQEQNSDIQSILLESKITITKFNHNTLLPFTNCYKSPKTIGLDRLASVAGAQFHYPNEDLLVIDAGTAITYDFLNANGEFLGGNISPGLQMRYKALNMFTERLPLLEANQNEMSLIGKTTNEAINNGILNGLTFEVDGMIEESKQHYPNLRIVFTGGDAFFFDAKIKNRIFVHPNLVLEGLNSILQYNAEK